MIILTIIILFFFVYYINTKSDPNTASICITYSEPYTKNEVETIANIAQKDINEYIKQNNYKYNIKINTKYLPSIDTKEDPYIDPLKYTIQLKKTNTNLIIGYQYSQQCKQTLNYTKNNDMIMMSPYSSDDSLAISNDTLFRLKCLDSNQGKIIAKTLTDLNISQIIIVCLDISWGNNIQTILSAEYEKQGGEIIYIVKYDSSTNKTELLSNIESTIQNCTSKPGIVFISIFDLIEIIQLSEAYPNITSCTWFGTEAITSKLTKNAFESEATSIYTKLRIISPRSAPTYTKRYHEIDNRYHEEVNQHLDYTLSAIYDACWIYTMSIKHSESIDAKEILYNIPLACKEYKGLIGECNVNQYGDRIQSSYEICQFTQQGSAIKIEPFGYYNSTNNQIIWDN